MVFWSALSELGIVGSVKEQTDTEGSVPGGSVGGAGCELITERVDGSKPGSNRDASLGKTLNPNCSQWDWQKLAWQQPTINVWKGEWEVNINGFMAPWRC